MLDLTEEYESSFYSGAYTRLAESGLNTIRVEIRPEDMNTLSQILQKRGYKIIHVMSTMGGDKSRWLMFETVWTK